ncbi:MAG: carbon storage regulator CsrA [Clostridiales bacterium]|jgi:carbon storage regulator|nr:carbon storage regulator CsrA [Clostridiales bacterium]
MLVISRKSSESFLIGDDIRITILEISGDKVKIGIEAPKNVNIVRTEVLETINANIDAVSAANPQQLDLLKNIIKRNKD